MGGELASWAGIHTVVGTSSDAAEWAVRVRVASVYRYFDFDFGDIESAIVGRFRSDAIDPLRTDRTVVSDTFSRPRKSPARLPSLNPLRVRNPTVSHPTNRGTGSVHIPRPMGGWLETESVADFRYHARYDRVLSYSTVTNRVGLCTGPDKPLHCTRRRWRRFPRGPNHTVSFAPFGVRPSQ